MKRPAELDDVDRKSGYKGMIFGMPVFESPNLTVSMEPFVLGPPLIDSQEMCDHEWMTAPGGTIAQCFLCGARTPV